MKRSFMPTGKIINKHVKEEGSCSRDTSKTGKKG